MWHKLLNILPFVFASLFWAGASVMQFRYGQSLFVKLNNPDFWNPSVSHKKAKKIWNWKYDGFHVFQSLAIICFCFPIADSMNYIQIIPIKWLNFVLWWVVVGIIWNVVFQNSYERLFTIKKINNG